VALLTYTVLAVAMFSSTWVHPTNWWVGVSGDAQQFMWFLGWPPFAITHGLNPIFSNYGDYPGGVNLMWNASELLPGVVLGPLTQAGGVVLSYNVLMTAAVALSAWTAYLLIRRYVSSQLAAAVGGLLRQRLRSRVDHLEGDLRVLRPVRQKTPLRHHRLALGLALSDDQRTLLGAEVEPVLVGLGGGDLEQFAYRLTPLTRCEPPAHEVGSLSIRTDGAVVVVGGCERSGAALAL